MGAEGEVTAYMVNEVERLYDQMWPGRSWQEDLRYANDPDDSGCGPRRSVLRMPDGRRLLLDYTSDTADGWGNSFYFGKASEDPIPVPDDAQGLDLDQPFVGGEYKRGWCYPSQLRFLSVIAACEWSQCVEVWT